MKKIFTIILILLTPLICAVVYRCGFNPLPVNEEAENNSSNEEIEDFTYDLSDELNATLVHNLQTVGSDIYLISYNRDNKYDDGFDAKVSVFSLNTNILKVDYEWHSFLDKKYSFRAKSLDNDSVMIYAGSFLMNDNNGEVYYQTINEDYYRDANYDFIGNRLFFVPGNKTDTLFVFDPSDSKIDRFYSLDENESDDHFLLTVKISPDGEKILTTKSIGYHQESVICVDSKGEEIFVIDPPTEDSSINVAWLNNEKILCYYHFDDGTKMTIYDSDGTYLKEFDVPFVVGEAQHDFSKSFPCGVFCVYGHTSTKGFESELWIVDFENGSSVKFHKTKETLHAFDFTEDGKSVVWVEDMKIIRRNVV